MKIIHSAGGHYSDERQTSSVTPISEALRSLYSSILISSGRGNSTDHVSKAPRPRINRPRTRWLAHAGNLCLFTAANEDFIDIFLI